MSDRSHSELIFNADGSIYHLNLLPGDLAPLIILVGDPDRVSLVSQHFDEITLKKSKREFHTHTGRIGNLRISVMSTGIGTDNIDIVLNEADALFNIDFQTRQTKAQHTQLTFVRIGTSGAIQEDIALDSFLISRYAFGMDALVRLGVTHTDGGSGAWHDGFMRMVAAENIGFTPGYMSMADETLLSLFEQLGVQRITVTCAGFYGLQGRSIRLQSPLEKFFNILKQHKVNGLEAGNLEMETAGIYLLAHMLGHRAISLNAMIANRALGTFSSHPDETVKKLIRETLTILSSSLR